MLVHCNRKFRPYVTQFLVNKGDYIRRKLEIGFCPVCLHQVAKLTQTKIQSNETFEIYYTRRKAEKIIRECSNQIDYTSNDVPKDYRCVFGFRYGETKEKTNKDGTKTITQRACDFFGNKEVVKTEIIGNERG